MQLARAAVQQRARHGGLETPAQRRRRLRRLAGLAIAVLVAAMAVAAIALVMGFSIEPEVEALNESGPTARVKDLERAERKRVARALEANSVLGVKRGVLESIAECESGGNPAARSADGLYLGKYQFDRGTWKAMGGTGSPAKAPELEQDYRAAELYKAAGTSPWPICG
ncbi:hypothetical protein BH20ACT15_BH20ACT15_16410 [soil metagenome]